MQDPIQIRLVFKAHAPLSGDAELSQRAGRALPMCTNAYRMAAAFIQTLNKKDYVVIAPGDVDMNSALRGEKELVIQSRGKAVNAMSVMDDVSMRMQEFEEKHKIIPKSIVEVHHIQSP